MAVFQYVFNNSLISQCSGKGTVKCSGTIIYIHSTKRVSLISHNYIPKMAGDSFTGELLCCTLPINKNPL